MQQSKLNFTSIDRPVVMLRFKGNRKDRLIHSPSTVKVWYNASEDRTIVLEAVPLIIGEKLIADLLHNVKHAYQSQGCQVEQAIYCAEGCQVVHMHK